MQSEVINDRKQSGKTRVKVAIRVRPMLTRQITGDYRSCVNIQSDAQILIGSDQDKGQPRQYKFDRVFKEQSSQNEVYTHCIKQLVLNCFEGYNAAVLAYGQTGSGKTYTMGTAVSTLSDNNSLGIIPRVITQIFQQVEKRRDTSSITVTATYIELYNEQIVDLLTDSQYKNKSQGIHIKEDRQSGLVYVDGVKKQTVIDPGEMIRLLQRGGMHRTTKQTNMNDVSSRSHAIFTIYIDTQPINDQKKGEDALSGITHSRFFFADLAGSQRAKKTGATGDTLKQGININMGLLQLGNVISALSTIQKNKDQFITFRNSKLTRILQDALGGNSNTYMIACVSPADFNFEQSLNTLKYASKAMNIKNTPVINRNKNDMLKQENQQLKAKIKKLQQMLSEKGIKFDVDEDRHDPFSAQSKLQMENRLLARRLQETSNQLKTTKHKLNEYEIKMYDIRREKDGMQMEFQQLLRSNPNIASNQLGNSLRERFRQNSSQKVQILQKNLQQIQVLETKLTDRDNLCSQLQLQYNTLLQNSKKDEQLLIKKHNILYKMGKLNDKLKKQLKKYNDNQHEQHQDSDIEEYQIIGQEDMDQDQIINQHSEQFGKQQQQTKSALETVDKYILEKEQFLEKISNEQIAMETEVINSMKNQYHQKIALLQKERKNLLKQRDEGSVVEKSRFINKIDILQQQLKDYRKKAKQQRNMQRQVQNQSNKIRDLGQQIKRFKMQKIQLHKKLKEDKDQYEKNKLKRIKELIQAKKENIKKQTQIRKIKLKTHRNEQIVRKKNEQIKRIKRTNQTLKNFIKPTNKLLKKDTNHIPTQPTTQDLKQMDKVQEEFVTKICKQIHYQINREQSIQTIQAQVQQAETQLVNLINQVATYRIKKDRLDLKAQEEELTQPQLQQRTSLSMLIHDYDQRIQNCQIHISQRQSSDLLKQEIDYFDIENTVIYNKQYENIDVLRSFVKSLIKSIKNYIYQNCQLLKQNKYHQRQIERLKDIIKEQRQNIMNVKAEYRRCMTQIREENMNRYYSQEPQPVSAGLKRLDQKEKKQMERKFQDLARSNRHLTSELEKTRRKCQIVQEKYQSIQKLVSKDRNIGRQQQEPVFVRPQKKLQRQNTNRVTFDELDGMLQNLNQLKKVKSFSNFEENHHSQNVIEEIPNQWQNIWKVDAHNSAIQSIAVHSNFLISTATKSIRIWDIEHNTMMAQFPSPGIVKYVTIDPQRGIFSTACDKSITLWSINALKPQTILKSHRDEVRVIHSAGDYLFTGGKGTSNSGSLMIWDFRKLVSNQPLQQKQKNQDIFTFASTDKMLYYGTRNHNIRRMSIGNWDVLSPFEPPHLDSVTGLTIVGKQLVSGSKDKHMKLWSLQHAVNNNIQTIHTFDDYITTLRSPLNHPIIYTGSKNGQIKTCYIKNDRIEILGSILGHTQSVNAVCTLDDNPYDLVTASQDKTIKIWQPAKQTKEIMNNIMQQCEF